MKELLDKQHVNSMYNAHVCAFKLHKVIAHVRCKGVVVKHEYMCNFMAEDSDFIVVIEQLRDLVSRGEML